MSDVTAARRAMIHEIRVIFGDTDQMGVVYYANYLRFFESARAALWRSYGKTHRDIEAAGIALPVVEAHCDYKRPAHYEDVIAVEIAIAALRPASMKFAYTVRRDADVLATGYTRHAVIGANGRPCALPDALRAIIG